VYVDINGLTMFYEIRGASDPAGVRLVLLHGASPASVPAATAMAAV
jgi:hypothetical protein